MRFDDALNNVEDQSIDLLHIDGSHHYNDVKHDFESWFPKVKADGVILFHDIAEDEVLGEKMGSYYYWRELIESYPFHCSFDFSCGLGIIFLNQARYEKFIAEVDLDVYQKQYNQLATIYKDQLRKDYFLLMNQKYYLDALKQQLKVKDVHLSAYANESKGCKAYIATLEQHEVILEKAITEYEHTEEERVKYISHLEEILDSKEQYVKELEKNENIKDQALLDYEKNTNIRNSYIEKLEAALLEKEQYLKELEKNENIKDQALLDYERNTNIRNSYIEKLEATLLEKEQYLKELENREKHKDEILSEYQNDTEIRNTYIKQLETIISEKDEYIRELEKNR